MLLEHGIQVSMDGREAVYRQHLCGAAEAEHQLKRAHGLGRLRVRRGPRVRLAVYLKALACNIKRMVRARLVEMAKAAQRLAETVPAVATP